MPARRTSCSRDTDMGRVHHFCDPLPDGIPVGFRDQHPSPPARWDVESSPGPVSFSALRLVVEEHHARVVGPHIHTPESRVLAKAGE
jgi:hypothetical protein